MLKCGTATFPSLFFHFQFGLPAWLAWFLQEMPSLLIPLYFVVVYGAQALDSVNVIVVALFITHYVQRYAIRWILQFDCPQNCTFVLHFSDSQWNAVVWFRKNALKEGGRRRLARIIFKIIQALLPLFFWISDFRKICSKMQPFLLFLAVLLKVHSEFAKFKRLALTLLANF